MGRNLPRTPPLVARATSTGTRPDRPRLTPREVDVLVNWFACESKDMVAGTAEGWGVRRGGGWPPRRTAW